jgi:hypothetical protein
MNLIRLNFLIIRTIEVLLPLTNQATGTHPRRKSYLKGEVPLDAMEALKGRECAYPTFFNFGTRKGWVVTSPPPPAPGRALSAEEVPRYALYRRLKVMLATLIIGGHGSEGLGLARYGMLCCGDSVLFLVIRALAELIESKHVIKLTLSVFSCFSH